jgi:hypothetical protein
MNSGRDEDDEDRWLVAHERGEPGPAIPDATIAKYAELQSLLEELPVVPAGASPRPGWQQSVLDAIDRGDVEQVLAAPSSQVRPIDSAPRKRLNKQLAVITVSALLVAAGIIIIVRSRPHESVLRPELAINALAAGQPAHLGQDELIAGSRAVVRGAIQGPGELRVYGADDLELTRCTATGPDCIVKRTGERTELRAEILLPAPGPLHVVLLSAPLPGPSGGRALDRDSADRAGIHYTSIDRMVR